MGLEWAGLVFPSVFALCVIPVAFRSWMQGLHSPELVRELVRLLSANSALQRLAEYVIGTPFRPHRLTVLGLMCCVRLVLSPCVCSMPCDAHSVLCPMWLAVVLDDDVLVADLLHGIAEMANTAETPKEKAAEVLPMEIG